MEVKYEDNTLSVGDHVWIPLRGAATKAQICSMTSTTTVTLLPGAHGTSKTSSVDITVQDCNGSAHELHQFLIWDMTEAGLVKKLHELIH